MSNFDESTAPTRSPAEQEAALASAASFAHLLSKLDYLEPADIELVRSAYRLADQAHLGQKRQTGEPYITHPITVAEQCTVWRLDASAIIAALLHDTMEDCGVSKADIAQQFGAAVADLVDGLTKLDKIQFATKEESQAESFRKMLLAMARDVRVILVKLADRIHNMRSLHLMKREKRERIARETMDIYAPLASRLGLNGAFVELQDLALRSLHPWRYGVLEKALATAKGRKRDGIQRSLTEIQNAFTQADMPADISGREKSLFSIYTKMREKQLSFSEVLDVYGLRILLPTLRDCYTALGVVHQLYKPLPGKFKDYIAIPKPNGYQSLHTIVSGPAGMNIEVQLRSFAMHKIADSGVAAHWLYKTHTEMGNSNERVSTEWLQSLMDIQQSTKDATEFWDHVRIDLFPDDVYVMTPKGEIISLPRGATVVDFAYAIHSNVGDKTVAAKINDNQVPLRHEVKNGDTVEVITGPSPAPNPAWLSFVRTGRARAAIRNHLKNMQSDQAQALGRKLLAQAVRAEGYERLPAEDAAHSAMWDKLLKFTGNKSLPDLYTDLCMGKRIASVVAKRLVMLLHELGEKPDPVLLSRARFAAEDEGQTHASQGLVIDGSETAVVFFEPCCCPIPGERIIGHLGQGEGVHIHSVHCRVGHKLRKRNAENFIEAAWADEPVRRFEKPLIVTFTNGTGMLAALTTEIARAEGDITNVNLGKASVDHTAELRFMVSVRDLAHYENIVRHVRNTAGVLHVQSN